MDFIGVFNAVKDAIGPVAASFVVMMVAVGGFLRAIEGVVWVIAKFTPWTWDDKLAEFLNKINSYKIFNKKS